MVALAKSLVHSFRIIITCMDLNESCVEKSVFPKQSFIVKSISKFTDSPVMKRAAAYTF